MTLPGVLPGLTSTRYDFRVFRNIWVANFGGNNVMRVDAASAVVTATVTGFSGPVGYGADAGSEV